MEQRIEAGTIIFPQDFAECSKIAKKKLDAVMSSFKIYYNESRSVSGHIKDEVLEKAKQQLSGRPSLIDKWCLNFLALLMLSAGGQRPQVYCQLQTPTEEEIANMKSSGAHCSNIELKTLREKTPQSTNLPNVILPVDVFPYLHFHVRVIRQVVKSYGMRNRLDDYTPPFTNSWASLYPHDG